MRKTGIEIAFELGLEPDHLSGIGFVDVDVIIQNGSISMKKNKENYCKRKRKKKGAELPFQKFNLSFQGIELHVFSRNNSASLTS